MMPVDLPHLLRAVRALETLSGLPAADLNPSHAAYWLRLTTACETLDDESTAAGETIPGYMLRCVNAIEALTETSLVANDNPSGYLLRLVTALEGNTPNAGSMSLRLALAADADGLPLPLFGPVAVAAA